MIAVNSRFLTQRITGVQRFALEISKALTELRDDLVFLSPRGVMFPELAHKLNVQSFGRLKGHLWEQLELPVKLREMGSPLLLNLANTAPLFYTNQIVTIHDLAVFRFPESFSKAFSTFYKFLLPRIARNSRMVLTVSEFSKGEIVNLLGIPDEKIHVIYNAVSENIKCQPVPLEKKEKFILTVSSLDPRKNLENLVRAFTSSNLKGYKLKIAGAESRVFSKVAFEVKSPDVEFLGYQRDDELSRLYERASLFVYPSLYEGFGIPPLEAMKCGTPVIVSRAASLPEVCGDAALYVGTDVESIKEGMERVLSDKSLMEELIRKGVKRVKGFSWQKSTKKLNRLLDTL